MSSHSGLSGRPTGKPERAHIWGNGADFDNVILTNAYRAVGISRPWEPYHDRCYRTLKNLRRDIHLYRTGTHHNALYDAITQAEHAVRLLQAVHIGHMLQTVRGTDDAATDEINDTQDFDTLPGYIADPSKMVDGEPIPVPEYGETAQDSKE